jgi:putative tributyrin esterase
MSEFRTVEISDSKFESNNLRFVTVKTPHLNGRGDICIFVPPEAPNENVPVVILLHGVYGSAWSWAHQAGVHLQAAEMIKRNEIPPMIIAMPSDGLWGDGSAYLPHNSFDFEKWIISDVPDALQETIFGASPESPLFIGGLSMGGFGALRIGAKYGLKFNGISGHSSITNIEQMKLFVEEDLINYYQKDKADEDVLGTILKHKEYLPPFRFDCGVSDKLIEYNRSLHNQLHEYGVDHFYEEFLGEHDWNYWTKNISKSLLFFAEQL